jgi:Flp pilus assembly pilin Flp
MFAEFLNAEAGAVTVDWTLLTAFVCGLAIAVVTLLSAAAQEPTNALNATLASDVVGDHDSFD